MRPLLLFTALTMALVPVHPAAAVEGFGERSADPTVRVSINESGGDAIELVSLGLDEEGLFNVSRNVADVFGLDSDEYETTPIERNDASHGRTIQADRRLVVPDGSALTFRLDVKRLTTVLQRYEVSSYAIEVCLPKVPVRDLSDVDTSTVTNDCHRWSVSEGELDSVESIELRTHPQPDSYWRWLAVVALVAGVLTVPALLVAYGLRRALRNMRTATLILLATVAAIALFVATIAGGVIANLDTPVTDLVYGKRLGVFHHFMAVLLPSLLIALPLASIGMGLMRLPPRPATEPDIATQSPWVESSYTYAPPTPTPSVSSPPLPDEPSPPAGDGWPAPS